MLGVQEVEEITALMSLPISYSQCYSSKNHAMTLMIHLPCAAGIVSEKTTLGLFNLGKTLVRNNIHHGLLTLTNSSLITQARSKIANFFINNTEHDYLFFLDSDIGFNPDDVLKLMSHQVPIVSGAYPMKIIPERYCVDVVQPEERHGDLLKINGNGMGFVLIHRQVFLDIARHYPNLKQIWTLPKTTL